MSDTVRVLLDTDPGSDIDDAVAISYLLRQKRCELMGITTVSGDTAQRAACAEVICREAGRADIPIHAGLSLPILVGPGQPNPSSTVAQVTSALALSRMPFFGHS